MGVFKDLFKMQIVEFKGWLTAITNSAKFNIIFDISGIGGLLAIATNLGKPSRTIFNNNIAI